ncbi:MAG: type VI secretion system tube protein Hcp [Planctomycetes bacterium]|nr:type VI secretion system tube protein Hcp [Planctomycetota bacterium]
MPIYMNFDKLRIKGNVTADGYKGWIELLTVQFGVGRGISAPVGQSQDRETSAPSLSEVVVSKHNDVSSALLFAESLQGEGVPVEIHLLRTAVGKLEVYLQFLLSNTLISGYSVSSGGDLPTESLSFNFTKIETKHVGSDAQGKAGASPLAVSYDLALAKVV